MTIPAANTFPEEISTPLDDHFYRLVDKKPVRCSLTEYALHMQRESNRIIAQSPVSELLVSTIFTGIDYSFGSGEKKLFETVIFGMEENIHPKWQHATWDEATEKHHQIVEMIKAGDIDAMQQKIQETNKPFFKDSLPDN